jgi:methyl-accepting chemotaxis protein
MGLEALIRDIKEQDLPFIQNMKEYVHLPNKRAFATGKYKLEKATEEIDENKDFVEELKRRTTESLEYIRNTYATVLSLNERAQMIQNMINQDVDLLSPEEVKPKLTDLQRVRLFHELSMIKDIADNYDNQMLDLSELFSDMTETYGITEVIDKTRDLISQINRVDNTLGKKNLKETIQKFITPQQEGYKKQKNKQILDIQNKLNELNKEIAKQGTSKSRLARKNRLEDAL